MTELKFDGTHSCRCPSRFVLTKKQDEEKEDAAHSTTKQTWGMKTKKETMLYCIDFPPNYSVFVIVMGSSNVKYFTLIFLFSSFNFSSAKSLGRKYVYVYSCSNTQANVSLNPCVYRFCTCSTHSRLAFVLWTSIIRNAATNSQSHAP